MTEGENEAELDEQAVRRALRQLRGPGRGAVAAIALELLQREERDLTAEATRTRREALRLVARADLLLQTARRVGPGDVALARPRELEGIAAELEVEARNAAAQRVAPTPTTLRKRRS